MEHFLLSIECTSESASAFYGMHYKIRFCIQVADISRFYLCIYDRRGASKIPFQDQAWFII